MLIRFVSLLLALTLLPVGAHGAPRKSKEDVDLPRVEYGFEDSIELPPNLSAPNQIDTYRDSLEKLLRTPPKESPYAARAYHLHLGREGDITEFSNRVAQFFSDNFTGLDRAKMERFVEANKAEGQYDELHFFVFISQSMPEATIRNIMLYFAESRNTVFLMRGVVGNDLKYLMPTLNWVKDLRCSGHGLENDCIVPSVDINPSLFQWLNIEEVPALAYVNRPEMMTSCTEFPITDQDYLIFYGDISPETILDKMAAAMPQDGKLQQLVQAHKPKAWERNKENSSHETTRD